MAMDIRRLLKEYGLALSVTLVASLARFALDPFLGDHLPYVTFFIAVAFTTFYASLGASLTTAALGGLTAHWFFMPPRHSLFLVGMTQQIGFISYCIVCFVFVYFGHALRCSRQRAEAAGDGLRLRASEHKLAMEALQESEERFHTLADNMSQLVWMADATGGIFWYNRRWYAYTGTTFEDMQGGGWKNVHHPDHIDRVVKRWRQSHDTGEPWEDTFPLRGIAGSYRWFLSRAMPIRDAEGKVIRWFGTNTDVTEQREVEAALRGSEERFCAAVHAVSSLIWTNNAQGKMVGEQQGWGDFTGQAYEEYQGYGWSKAVHPEDAQPTIDAWNEKVAQKRTFVFEHRVRRHDGEWRLCSIRAVPVMTGEGAIREWVGVHTDITESRLTEQALRESEERLRSFAGHLEQLVSERTKELVQSQNRLGLAILAGHAGTFDWDITSNTNVWSDELLALYGMRSEEFGGRYEDWIACLLPEDREAEVNAIKRSLETGEFVADFRIRRCDNGEIRWMDGRGRVFFDDAGKPARMVGINMDITDRKRAEEAHGRAEKFAEELERQVLSRTRELVVSQERLRALATELNLAEQRERKRLAGELHDYLAQLLVLCRLNLGQVRQVGVPLKAVAIVSDTEEMLNEALNYSRTLMAELSPPVLQEHGLTAGLEWLGEQMRRRHLTVTVDIGDAADLSLPEDCAVLLFQSVRELLMNVLKHAGSKEVAIRLNKEDGRLRIEVRDKGIGFDLAAASAAGPTTAMSSKFGLFSIRERMRALGGWFDLQSAPGEGTMAILVLPLGGRTPASSELGMLRSELERPERGGLSAQEHNSELMTPHSTLHQQDGRIRVLLVDDHSMVRQGLRSMLESYADVEIVGEAGNGEEAVALVERLQPSIVVMDINMPKMNGIEATAKIKFRFPRTIVIGLSVQTGGANQEAMRKAGASMLLTKEAAVDELYRAIQATLGAKGLITKRS